MNIKSRYKRYTGQLSTDYCYSFILFDKYGIDNCAIELVETFMYNDEDELKWKERDYIENNKCVNNKLPIVNDDEKKERTKEYNKQYYDDNLEYFKQYDKQYKIDHKEEISERNKIKIYCSVCDVYINQYYKSKHDQSEKHQNIINNIIKPVKEKYLYCEACDCDISRKTYCQT